MKINHALVLLIMIMLIEARVKLLLLPFTKNTTLELEACQPTIDKIKSETGIDVIVEFAGTSISNDYLSFVSSLLTFKDVEYDILSLDIIWPGQFSEHFVDLTNKIPKELLDLHLQAIVENDNVNQKQIAVPLFVDYGVLFYRTDLLQKYNYTSPPQTWDEMHNMLATILPKERASTNPDLYGFSGNYLGYEGLTCTFVQWLYSIRSSVVSSEIIALDKTVKIVSEEAIKLLDMFSKWITRDSFTPIASLLWNKADLTNKWLQGNLVFMLNWPAAAGATRGSPLKTSFGVSPLPGSVPGKSGAALGGYQLAVSKYSKNIDDSVKVLQYFLSPEFQKERAIKVGYLPSVKNLYFDKDVCNALGYCDVYQNLQVVARPSSQTSPRYLQVSANIFGWVNKILGGTVSAEAGLRNMTVDIQKSMNTFRLPSASVPVEILYSGIALASIGILVTILFAAAMFKLQKHEVFVAASPLFLSFYLFGALLAFVGLLVFNLNLKVASSCNATLWLFSIGCLTLFTAMVIKNWRIQKVFQTSSKLKVGSVTPVKMVIYIGSWVAVNVIILLCFLFSNGGYQMMDVEVNSHIWNICGMQNQTTWLFILMCPICLTLLFGIFISFGTRNVWSKFNESKHIMMAIYTFTLSIIILIPLVLTSSLPSTQHLLINLVANCSLLLVISINFLPKLLVVYSKTPLNEGPMETGIKKSTAGSSVVNSQRGDERNSQEKQAEYCTHCQHCIANQKK
ncbi:hypothetical protein HDU92_005030 [Lobulomyces angularis]|nr:hypothetical protein HDU92_005030 [Lobulomyces angularis]